MNPLKRIEVWLLLAFIIAGVVWVFTSRPAEDQNENAVSGVERGSTEPALLLHRISLKRDYGNARLDLDLRVRNDKSEKLVLQPPTAKLLTTDGREVPSFFLPFDPAPEVPANSSRDVQLRYWLDANDLQGGLTLHVDGENVKVKSTDPVDIATLKNGEEKIITRAVW